MDQEELNRAWLEVDLRAVRRNAERLAARAGVPLIAMVKADAYGLGAVAVARALRELPQVWGFGVATVAEGRVLRDAGIDARLFCPTPVLQADFGTMQRARITPSLSRVEDIERWCGNAAGGAQPWHLSIDTGINRAGAAWDEIEPLREVLRQHPPEGAFTHFFATGLDDSSRALQEKRFRQAVATSGLRTGPDGVLLHVDNSLGIAVRSSSPYQLARPGIALYGWPSWSGLELDSVVSLRARVVDVRTVSAGEGVSYGATWIAPSERRVATISIGHADGYRRAFSSTGQVVINGTRCPVVGIVTMDMTMVDVTGVACEAGDAATVVGAKEGLDLDEVAAYGAMSPYELLVGFKLRLPRVYSDGDQGMTLEQIP